MDDGRPALRKGVYLQQKPEGLLLMMPEGYMELDQTAWEILDMCNGRNTVEMIVAVMAERYEGDPEIIRADVLELLQEIRQDGLLEYR